ncbi:MAG: DUF92 domain-containing protein, partial [Acidobacteria bacterium]|nr:DUF92 domain-containing protein [Acidobacteriota bacterium]
AESDHGRRGLESVFSKGIAPAVFCWLSVESFIASLAFYAADTVATEIGKTNKGKTFSIVSFKKVNSGTAGGVSLKGSVAGIFSIAVFLLVSSTMLKNLSIYQLSGLAITLTVFFFLESIVNDLNAKFQVTSKIVIHIVLGFLAGSFSNAIRVYLK